MMLHYNTLFIRLYVTLLAVAVGLGVAFGSSAIRFAGPSFKGAVNLVTWLPFPPHLIWGGLFLTYGTTLLLLLGRMAAIHALRAGVVLYLFLATSFVHSMFLQPMAAASGVVVYTGIAVIHAFLSDHLTHQGWEGC